jgi:hypothetical protein
MCNLLYGDGIYPRARLQEPDHVYGSSDLQVKALLCNCWCLPSDVLRAAGGSSQQASRLPAGHNMQSEWLPVLGDLFSFNFQQLM